MPPSMALPIVADTTPNLVYKAEWGNLEQAVNRGEALTTYLRAHAALFPDMLTHMISVGERTGNLSNTLVYLSEFYGHEIEDMTRNLSSLIEPALMIFMGLFVGFIAISIITPIYAITQNLHP